MEAARSAVSFVTFDRDYWARRTDAGSTRADAAAGTSRPPHRQSRSPGPSQKDDGVAGGQVQRIGSQLRACIGERQPKDHADQNEAE